MNKEWSIRTYDGRIATHHRVTNPDGSKRIWWSIDGSNGLSGLSPSELPLYGYDRLKRQTSQVIVTEGEKAADALLDRRIAAVGTVTGASITPNERSLRELIGKDVYLWADNDVAGIKHMDAVASRLFVIGVEQIYDIKWAGAPAGGDADDFFQSSEGTIAALKSLVRSAGKRKKLAETPSQHQIQQEISSAESTDPKWLILVFDALIDFLERNGFRPVINGASASALCPLHDDHQPSLSLHAERGWKCFAGCGQGRLTRLANLLGVRV